MLFLPFLPDTAVLSEADRLASRFVLPQARRGATRAAGTRPPEAKRPRLRGDDDLADNAAFGRLVCGRGGGQRKLVHRQAGKVTRG